MISEDYNVDYKISLHKSSNLGYQSKSGKNGVVKVFVSNIWEWYKEFLRPKNEEFEIDLIFRPFVNEMINTIILERICLERGFQKIRMKDRCKPYKKHPCKMMYITFKILELLDMVSVYRW